jgi:hypothetical protein
VKSLMIVATLFACPNAEDMRAYEAFRKQDEAQGLNNRAYAQLAGMNQFNCTFLGAGDPVLVLEDEGGQSKDRLLKVRILDRPEAKMKNSEPWEGYVPASAVGTTYAPIPIQPQDVQKPRPELEALRKRLDELRNKRGLF